MSQSERERALVTQWRNTAKRYDFPTKSLEDATYSATLDRCADELAAALDTPQEPTPGADDYVAWLRSAQGPGDSKRIVTCDSDSPGAFKVYRWPAAPEPTPAAPAVANARLELTDAVNTTPAAPPDPKHLPKGNLLGDTANELAKIAEALKTTNALRGREVFEIAIRIGWWANAVKALEAQDAAAPRPALSPDALLVQKILEDAANLLDDYWLHDAKGNLIATKGNLRAAILGLKSKYLRAPAPREGA